MLSTCTLAWIPLLATLLCESPPDAAAAPLPPIPPMVEAPGGPFLMGRLDAGDDARFGEDDELPRHEVTVAPCRIGKYEVTNAEFAAVLNWALATGRLAEAKNREDVYLGDYLLLAASEQTCQLAYTRSGFLPSYYWTERTPHNYPVIHVTWYGAAMYCNWLSEAYGLEPAYDTEAWTLRGGPRANSFRLPTEAEWERAAAYDPQAPDGHWIYGHQSNEGWSDDRFMPVPFNCRFYDRHGFGAPRLAWMPYTSEVGVFAAGQNFFEGMPSPAGCWDMSGNVWEWCHDWYAPDTYRQGPWRNPAGPERGAYRVSRGGSWESHERHCRTAKRNWDLPAHATSDQGFRIVLPGRLPSAPVAAPDASKANTTSGPAR